MGGCESQCNKGNFSIFFKKNFHPLQYHNKDMKIINFTLLVICLVIASSSLKAQDERFSMFYNSPLLLNPALTGSFLEDMRFTAQYRNQWSTVTVPFQTMAASFDMSVFKGELGDDYVGFGLQFMNDEAGDLNYRNTQAQLSLAYHKSINGYANQYLTAGVQAGIGQQGISVRNALFDSQYDGSILNPNIPSGEVIDRPNFTYPDLTAGISWYYVPDERTSFYAGASLAHLNKPNMSFHQSFEDPLARRLTLHAGFQLPIGPSIAILPRAVVFNQDEYTEFNVGALLKFEVHPDYGVNYGQSAFYVGTMHRVGDAQIVMVRFDYNNIGISASYDINISDLDNASRGNGGFEIGLSYRMWLFGQPGVGGPMGCPVW